MKLWRSLILFYIGGMVYILVELVWRGWSHPSMFVVGGFCFVMIGELNGNLLRWNTPLAAQAVLCACAVTLVELISGLILNVWGGLNVWDYGNLPFNFMGQICLYYFLLWIPMSVAAIWADDWLRHLLFGEERPTYKLL